VTKLDSSPDITYVIGKTGFLTGCTKWWIKVISMGSELRVGLSLQSLLPYKQYTLSERNIIVWSDSGGLYAKGNRQLDFPGYRAGDVLSLELNFMEKGCKFYKNDEFVGIYCDLPPVKLYPLVALDYRADCVVISALPFNKLFSVIYF